MTKDGKDSQEVPDLDSGDEGEAAAERATVRIRTGKKAAGKKAAPVAPAQPEPGFTRRQLLYTAAAAGATVATGLVLLDRDDGVERKSFAKIRDHRVERPAGSVDMAIVRGGDAAANARRAIEAMGGMEAFVGKGESVVVKPNIGWNRVPDQAANTNPEVVAEIVRMVVAAGASKVWVTDVPVNTPERCFQRSGIQEAAGNAGADIILPSPSAFRDVEVGGIRLRMAEVLYPFVDADKVINVPVAKQHGLTKATLSMKNYYGVLGGHRVLLHQDIHRYIVDLAVMMKPTLTVLDATLILLANGPSGGSLDDVKRVDAVAVSTDQVAIDTFGASLLDLLPADIDYIGMGERAGLGTTDLSSLKLVELSG